MRTVAVALLALLAAVGAMPQQQAGKEADQVQLTRQRDVIRLLTRYHQPLLWEDMATISRDYKIQPDNYKEPHVAEHFLQVERYGEFLPVNEPVSVFDDYHVDQIKLFFDLLYFAKDYDTFYKTALYLRERVNKGQFLAAFISAVHIREDARFIVLPPLYEIFPQLFITSDVMQQAYDAKLDGYATSAGKQYIIPANYTGYPHAHTPEQKMSYFTEDVGLNEFWANFHYRYPYFLSAANYTIQDGDARGDIFYAVLHKGFARYYMERLSNGLPDVTPIDYYSYSQSSYYPQLRLKNGLEMAPRPENQRLSDADVLAIDRIYRSEYRLYEVVEMGRVISDKDGRKDYKQSEATNLLGNLVQSTADSLHPRYYGALYRELLSLYGRYLDPTYRYGLGTSVFGKYETLLRDPVYFQIMKRILNIFHQYQNYLPPYSKQELEFPGLKIASVDVDRLVTYFEDFDIEVTNALKVSSAEETEKGKIFARQPRLNHKQFTYRIKVASEKPVKAIFRVFYGPRYDSYGNEMPFDEARQYFMEWDRFVYQVPAGESEISRSSRDSIALGYDSPPAYELMAAVNEALQGKGAFRTETIRRQSLPERLLLPRGTRAGMPLRFYVLASPVPEGVPAASVDTQAPATSYSFDALTDGRSVGFPFDRRIPHYFNIPNSYMEDVVVYHKTIDEINRPAA